MTEFGYCLSTGEWLSKLSIDTDRRGSAYIGKLNVEVVNLPVTMAYNFASLDDLKDILPKYINGEFMSKEDVDREWHKVMDHYSPHDRYHDEAKQFYADLDSVLRRAKGKFSEQYFIGMMIERWRGVQQEAEK